MHDVDSGLTGDYTLNISSRYKLIHTRAQRNPALRIRTISARKPKLENCDSSLSATCASVFGTIVPKLCVLNSATRTRLGAPASLPARDSKS